VQYLSKRESDSRFEMNGSKVNLLVCVDDIDNERSNAAYDVEAGLKMKGQNKMKWLCLSVTAFMAYESGNVPK
jgi:hypothetical protein